MRRLLIPVSLLFMFGTSIAQEVQQSNASFAAVPAEKGGQDIFGAYDIVENWPKDTAMSAGHEEWTFAAVRGVYAESPDRILAVQLGELPNIERPAPRVLPEIGPGIGFPVARAPWRSYRAAQGAGGANLLSGQGAREGIDFRDGHGIIVFDGDGNLIEEWTQWDSILERPHSIYISPYDSEKHVWVIDDGLHVIYKFTNDGKQLVQTIGVPGEGGIDETHLFWPSYMAWAGDGSFYVSDGADFYDPDRPLGARVVKYDKDGNYLLEWGQEGIPPNESRPAYFNNVHGIAVDPATGRVFVNDRQNHRVQAFTADGEFLHEWPVGDAPSDLHMFIISTDSYLWAADRGSNRILKYDLDGNFLYAWGISGDFPGGMWGVHAISVDSEGNFYVAEVDNGRVQKYRPRPGANPDYLIAPAASYVPQ
ncbi:MAG: hypothetical protein P8J68_04020 [Arenicellaceae bacterium]|nr:hypothetical protein [Arenicellaceae bacterium]